MLRYYVDEDQNDWHRYVKLIMFANNSSLYPSTGHSPFYLLHGFESNQPIDLALLPSISDHGVLVLLQTLYKIWNVLPTKMAKTLEAQWEWYNTN